MTSSKTNRFVNLDDFSISCGGELLVPIGKAENFLFSCLEGRLAVLGIESFHHREGSLVPDIDMIADFSDSFVPSETWDKILTITHQDTMSFIQKAVREKHDLVLTFVLVAENERDQLLRPE